MEIISLNKNNIEQEHICCVIADKKSQSGVSLKKNWLKERFEDGLKFKKLNVRGKVFIEYIPSEKSWKPIDAPNYMVIHCLWVSGKYKEQGYAKKLLEECENDAQDKNGICVITSKQTFLTDKHFYLSQGFEVCDTAPPYFELLVKQFNSNTPKPKFNDTAKSLKIDDTNGISFYYSDQCPYFDHYLNEMIEIVNRMTIPYKKIKLENAEQAQNVSSAYGTFNIFLNGKFLTHKPMTGKQFEGLLNKNAL